MAEGFRRFVIFAEMRTGSNLLEATLNRIRRVTCFGEAFNPYMMGWPEKTELQGITMAEREADPLRLLRALWDKPDHLPGFRYFHDHDPRILDAVLDDRDCAKIMLTRNLVDSYVSTRLAWATNQWKLNETETAQPARIRFDGPEFAALADRVCTFQAMVLRRTQASGQPVFWLHYDDLRNSDVLTGLMHWLGRRDLDGVQPASDQVPQNPRDMADKVENLAQMRGFLAQIDPFGLSRTPNFEPARGPAVPSFSAAGFGRGLLFLPIRGGPEDEIRRWLEGLGNIQGAFTQNTLRQWKKAHPGHRSFTVLRHPLHRAWQAFLRVLGMARPDLRDVLRSIHRVDLPPDDRLATMSQDALIEHFAAFLAFLRRNLNGQTSLPTHPGWATQTEVLAGFARFCPPDAVLREDRLHDDLAWIAHSVGSQADVAAPDPDPMPGFLDDPDLRALARAAYQRDYVNFGFSD